MSKTITEFNLPKFKEEIQNKLRFGINSDDNRSRITEQTSTFNGNGSETKFLLSTTSMAYVKSIAVDGTPLIFGEEWDILWRGADIGKVEIYSPPAVGTDNISIVWGNINTDKSNFVHSDFPRTDLGVHSYPRVGFETTVRRKAGGLGGDQAVISNDILLQIKVVDIDTYNIDHLINQIDLWLIQNSKGFYYFNWIEPQNIAQYDNYDDNTEQVNYKVIEYIIPRKLQVVDYA